jgi:hypothetical protein
LPGEKSGNDAFQLAAEKTEHPDAGGDQGFFERRRDGPAEQHIHSLLGQLLCAFERVLAGYT